MSKSSVSEFRNRLNLTRMFYDIQNHGLNDLPSEGKSVDAEVVKSSNCVINIDYVVQEEKISFEVFRSSMDSNCVFKKKFSLRRSKSCTQLNSTENPLYKVSKLVQTNDTDTPQILSRSNLGPPMFKKNHFERPVKDNTNMTNSEMYKENYGVSNFKFSENPFVTEERTSNFCSLEFDGTRSIKKNYYRTKTKHNHIKRVRSNIDIKKQTRLEVLPAKLDFDAPDYNLNNFPGFENCLNNEITKKSRHKDRDRKSTRTKDDLQKNEHVAFQFALTPKNETFFNENITELEKVESPKHKHRRIIVTSNTLQPTVKPNMKNVQQQTNLTELFELADNTSSINELYIKPNYRISRPVSVYSEDKRTRKKRNMTMTIFPCMEISSSHCEDDAPYQKRPTMPRRKIGSSNVNLNTVTEDVQLIKNEKRTNEKMKKQMPRRPSDTDEKIETLDQDCENICDKLTKMLKEEKKSSQYNKKIDELCILINSLLKDKDRSRSQSPISKSNLTNVSKQEIKKVSVPKLEKLNITHNKKDAVSIMSSIADESPNLVPRNVLQVSPRANEILKSQENKRRNISIANQLSIMPDPKQLEQVQNVDSTKKTHVMFSKQKDSVTSSKKPVESKGNCSSVTFSSQVAIMGKIIESVNEDNLKNTLFPVNRVLFKRSKTLPSKPDFTTPSSINSTVASSFVGDLSSFSNSDVCSVAEEKSKIPKPKPLIEQCKSPKPGAVENSTFLRTKSIVQNNTFQKRKDYYKNLKFKMKNKLYAPDFGRISESSNSRVPSLENIEKQHTNKDVKLNSTVTVLNNENKKILPIKEVVSKNNKKSTIFPFHFTETNINDNGKNDGCIYPTNKNISPHKVEDVKQRITHFLQSYPLEIASPHPGITPPSSLKELPIIPRVKSKLPKRI